MLSAPLICQPQPRSTGFRPVADPSKPPHEPRSRGRQLAPSYTEGNQRRLTSAATHAPGRRPALQGAGWTVIACLFVASALETSAQILYDASLGSLPDEQGWGYASNPLTPMPFLTVTNGVLFLDSTPTNSTQAGYGLLAPTELNRTNSFAVSFTVQLHAESHTGNANRAGFSVIALGSDARGIELGFWTNSVWAQADLPLFTRAESAAFPTTTAFVNYVLTVGQTNYALFADGHKILSGRVRDYHAFAGFPDVYETPNLLFFGDNTGSAQAAWSLKEYRLIQPPVLVTPQAAVLRWQSSSNLTYAVEASTNLTVWSHVASVTSATENYACTNSEALQKSFLRVRFP